MLAKKISESKTSPIDQQQRKKVKIKSRPPVVAFFIGGAGDKESYYGQGPYRNVFDIVRYTDPAFEKLSDAKLYRRRYLGYNEVFRPEDIEKNVVQFIDDRKSPIYIIGHSLGGWNGAHLSNILNNLGYNVEMLITLDPVGRGAGVRTISLLHPKEPHPAAKYWINVRAQNHRDGKDISDIVASLGGPWVVTRGPHLNYIAKYHHASALHMFVVPLKDNQSAAAIFVQSVAGKTKQ